LDKAPDAFRTISEVADDLDIPQHVLRFWETRFSQIKPMKRSGGRRYYRPDDVDLLRGIRRLLYGEGYTIRGVQRILKENGIKSVQSLVGTASPAFAPVRAEPSRPVPPADDRDDADGEDEDVLETDAERDDETEAGDDAEDHEDAEADEDENEEDGEEVVARAAPGQSPEIAARSFPESRANPVARREPDLRPPREEQPGPPNPPQRLDRELLEAVLNELLVARQVLDAAMKDT
jgi:DNA-binding transcriptional MerR regulator